MILDTTLRALFLVVDNMPKPKTFLYNTFFGDKSFEDKEEILIEYKNGHRYMAPFVNRYLPGQEMPKETFSGKYFRPHKIAPKKTFQANEFAFERIAGENPFNPLSPEDKKRKKIGDTLSEQVEQITRRLESMAAEVLYNLTLTIEGEGITDKVGFYDKNPKEHVTSVAVTWDNPNSNPIDDLKTALREITKVGGTRPSAVILDPKASDLFQNNSKVKELMNLRNYYVGQVKPEIENVNGVIYIGTLTSLGLDIYEYQEFYDYKDSNGEIKTKELVPEYTALLAPKGNMVKFAPESTIKDGLIRGEMIPRTYESEENDTVTIRTISKPVLIPVNTKSLKVLKVK
ncbi:MAG: major capsid protein [Leptotrichiaceae bacterium]|nr:major capsid protein [Leptotrichiaceae bacterium]MBP7739176.1 major capsid protein [Leptotrichiaceae bacterium]MBP9629671.1 major capsid protein [Leptotrichiaceae bacterium]